MSTENDIVELDDDDPQLDIVDDPVVENDDSDNDDSTDDEPKAKKPKGHDDDDSEEYSKKVQKRINKLVAERNAEREARIYLEQQQARYQEALVSSYDDDIDTKIGAIKKKRVELLADGEIEEAENLNDQLIDLKIRKDEIIRQKRAVQEHVQRQQQPQSDDLPDPQKEWLTRNNWYYDKEKADKARAANDMYLSLVNDEGYDPHDPDLYAELDRRIKPTARQQAPTGLTPNRGSYSESKSSSQFSQRDQKLMREFGLDPNNPEQRKEWIRNKQVSNG